MVERGRPRAAAAIVVPSAWTVLDWLDVYAMDYHTPLCYQVSAMVLLVSYLDDLRWFEGRATDVSRDQTTNAQPLTK